MNYGAIAYINQGNLFLPEYLLRPLNIDNNSKLTLLAYSTPKINLGDEEIKKDIATEEANLKNQEDELKDLENKLLELSKDNKNKPDDKKIQDLKNQITTKKNEKDKKIEAIKNKKDKEIEAIAYRNLTRKHDILITPIPYRLWPFQIRIKVYLQERNGAVAALTNYLKSENLNILNADCHRSGFRSIVYSCFLECHDLTTKYKFMDSNLSHSKAPLNRIPTDGKFEDIMEEIKNRKKGGEFKNMNDREIEEYMIKGKLRHQLNEIKKDLEETFKPVEYYKYKGEDYKSFEPKNKEDNDQEIEEDKTETKSKKEKDESQKEKDEDESKERTKFYSEQLRQFLFIPKSSEIEDGMKNEIEVSSTLPHHYFKAWDEEAEGTIRLAHYAEYKNGSIKLPKSLLAEFRKNYNLDLTDAKNTPTFGFVNLDSKAPRLRVTFRSKKDVLRFRRISIDYRRDSLVSESSKGLVAFVSERLTSIFNVALENVVTRIWINKRKTEIGTLEIIGELNCDSEHIWSEIEDDLGHALRHHSGGGLKTCKPKSDFPQLTRTPFLFL